MKVLSAAIVAISLCGAAHAAPPQYRVVDLGTLPGDTVSYAYGINDLGQIVGYSADGGAIHAYVHTPGQGMVAIGTLPGDLNSTARAINNSGSVVGSSWSDPLSAPGQAYVWSPTSGMDGLGTLPGGSRSEAWAIGDGGVVSGQAEGTGFSPEPFQWQPGGTMQPLAQATAGIAFDVNGSGAIAGEANQRAMVWSNGGSLTLAVSTDYPKARAQAIDGVNNVAGTIRDETATTTRLATWNASGELQALQIVGRLSHVWDMNDAGWFVGVDNFSVSSTPKGFVHSPADGLYYAQDHLTEDFSQWTIRSVNGINAQGQLAATGENALGQRRALRLDPVLALPNFDAQTNVPMHSWRLSNVVTVSGLIQSEALNLSGDPNAQYRVNDGPWQTTQGQIQDGDQLQIRQLSADLPLTVQVTTVAIGAATTVFQTRTDDGDRISCFDMETAQCIVD